MIREIIAALEDTGSFGALLVGDAGTGKTAVARAVLEEIDWTAPVLPVTGSASLRGIPFGAFAPYLHTLAVVDADSPIAVLRAVMAHLAGERKDRAQQHPPLIVVDDAHELDDDSTLLLTQLVSARRAKVFMTMQGPPTLSAEFQDLSTDDLLMRIDLAPLDLEAVTALCRQRLGGPVLSGTAHALASATGGNPRLLRALLDHAEEEGRVEQHNRMWRMVPDKPMVNRRLHDRVRAQLGSRDEAEMAVLELIALVEPVSLEALSRCVDEDVFERVRGDRLVVVGQGPEHVVSLDPPLYGEVLRSRIPIARSLLTRRTILGLQPPIPPSPEGFLRTVAWGLDCGTPAADPTLLSAASLANDLRDHTLALRAARAVSAPELRGQALIEIARARRGCSHHCCVRSLVDEALGLGQDLQVAKDGSLLSFELGLESGASSDDLRRIVERWESLIAEIERLSTAAAATEDLARARLACALLEYRVRLLEGRLEGLEEELRHVLLDPFATAEHRVQCLLLLAELLGMLGRPVDGLAHSGEALGIIEAEGARLLADRERAVGRHVVLLTICGREQEAKTLIRTHIRAAARSVVFLAAWEDFVDGTTALRAARHQEASDRFLLAAEGLRTSGDGDMSSVLIGMAAYACALAGETERAAAFMDEFEGLPTPGSRSMHLCGRIFVTAAAARLDDAPPARAELIGLAARVQKVHLKELAVTALRLALLLGDINAIDPLVVVLDGYQGRDARGLLDLAVAVREKDPDTVVTAATSAGHDGDVSLEYAGLRLALHLMEGRSSTRQTRAIQRRLVKLRERSAGISSASPGPALSLMTSSQLTPTERKIVALVGEGRSNREIAEDRGVSVRTVEGHLYRIFAKLGVNRRTDLREP
nr:LuxR C-terminal-related transcriptional regulator [uncultured Arthrobacter sp.]